MLSIEYSIGELVKRDQNGVIFQDASDLADRLQVPKDLLIDYENLYFFFLKSLLHGFPDRCLKLNSLKSNLVANRSNENWTKEWDSVMKPLLHLDSM